jgi:hypothetical protein
LPGSVSQEVYDSCDNSRNEDPEKLEPVKEGHPNELWLAEVVERRVKQDNKGQDKQDEQPGTITSARTGWTIHHESFPFFNYSWPSKRDAHDPQIFQHSSFIKYSRPLRKSQDMRKSSTRDCDHLRV